MSDPGVGVLMFVAYRHMEQRILEAMHEQGYAATLAQGRLFARVGAEGTRLTDLAEMAQVTKQTAGFLTDQLERLGYVERVPDPTDARARLVTISAHGAEAQAAASGVERRIEQEWRDHLGDADFAVLEQLLVRLRQITDPYA